MDHPVPCIYRHRVRREQNAEKATCQLLQVITGLKSDRLCSVRRDACEACCQSFPPSPTEMNPVIASLLYELTDRVIDQGGVNGCTTSKAARLQQRAEQNLDHSEEESHIISVSTAPSERRLARTSVCDVIVCCQDSSERTERAIRSVLAQLETFAIIHLIDDGGGGKELLGRYHLHPSVVVHYNPVRLGLFETLHELVPHLRSEFVAVQDARTTSRPYRLLYSVEMLTQHGADLFAAALQCPDGIIFPRAPRIAYRSYVPSPTLVFRRAALVDMGGISHRREGVDVELVYRLAREKRKILLTNEVTVDSAAPWVQPAGAPPDYKPKEGTLHHHARGFPQETVNCDVVLPFHGHLDFLQEALQSLLEQEGAELVIHLIDDATPKGAEPVLRYWGTHPRVRTYRNDRNLGQFTSFNNVFPYLETGLVAVQDADDISLPNRIRQAGNNLRLSNADIFAGRTRLFGDSREAPATTPTSLAGCEGASSKYRFSRVPAREQAYFLENPTAVMQVSAFAMLGGFADFGEPKRNRCGIDTEFYLRAYYSGVRFAISRDVVLKYRCHGASATRHPLTRWGAPAREWAEAERRRRTALFQQRPFDPRAFGSLGTHWGMTRRVK